MIKIKSYFGITVLGILIMLFAGCTVEQSQLPPHPSPSTPVTSDGGLVKDYVSLVDNLRNAEATVNPVGEITQPFFSVDGFVINIDGEEVQVFEYATAEATAAEASTISPDGSSIGTSMVSWMASPHFWNVEKLIVLYVGENNSIVTMLDNALGTVTASDLPQ